MTTLPNGDMRATVQELLVEIAVLHTKLDSAKEAVNLQAEEYKRRLTELNHAHSRAENTLNTFTPRELFERAIKEVKERTDLALKEVESWRRTVDAYMANNSGHNRGVSDVWGWITAALIAGAAVAHYFLK